MEQINDIYNLIFVALRVGGVFVTFPYFANTRIPNTIKVSFLIVITYFIASVVKVKHPFLSTMDILPYILNEVLIGLLIGMVGAILYFSVSIAGHLIDNASGLMMSSLYDPTHGTNATMYETLYSMILGLLFILLNGPYFIIKAIVRSYETIPNFIQASNQDILFYFVDVITKTFVIAIQLALPIAIIVILSDITLGLISRTIPQLNVFVLGMPIKLLVGFFLFIVLSEPIIQKMIDIVEVIINEINNVVNLL